MTYQDSIECRDHPSKRRGLYTTRPFVAGQVIATFPNPLLLLPTVSSLKSICTHCFEPCDARACTRCFASYYCSAACQAADWKSVHKQECKALKQVSAKDRTLPTPTRALLQVLLRGEDVMKKIEALEGNVEGKRSEGGERWRDTELMAMGACMFAGKQGTAEEVQRAVGLLCKIQVNTFDGNYADSGETGIFLDPLLAMANHSCMTNAMVRIKGRQAFLRARKSIQAGEEIEISYTDITWPLSKRQAALHAYSFTCQCPRCIKDMNVYQAFAEFPPQNANSSLTSKIPDMRRHPGVIDEEKRKTAREFGEALVPVLEDSQKRFGSLEEQRQVVRKSYRQCRELIDQELWAVSPLPQVLNEIAVFYSAEQKFPMALVVRCFIATECDPYRYPEPFSPDRVQGLLRIAQLLTNTAETAALSLRAVATKSDVGQKVLTALSDIDQVSLCQMLLIMALKAAPKGFEKGWEGVSLAREMLDEIRQLRGRERETSLIDSWAKNPESQKSEAFFNYAVRQQIQTIADMAPLVLANFMS